MDIGQFKRLITHDDFDGIVCAVLLTTINPKLKIEFHTPDYLRLGEIKIDDKTIIADLPYIEGCGLWFDHHKSNKGKGFHEIAPSTARIIYNNLHLKYPELFRYEDLVKWCDMIDSAKYSKNDILNPQSYVLISFTLSLDEGKDENKYRLYLIDLMKKLTIDDILNDSVVKEKIKEVKKNLKNYIKIVRKKVKIYDNLFYVLDLRGIDIDPGIKFVAHTLLDDQKIGVFLKDKDDKVKFSLSYNYLYRGKYEPIDLSKITRYYGGGGHPRASGVTVSKDKADEVLKEIIKVLELLDWEPNY